jgi:hypothetical protein
MGATETRHNTSAFSAIGNPTATIYIYMYGAPPVMQRGKVGFLLYSGISPRSLIEASLITREDWTETYVLLVIMAVDAQARPFFEVSSIMLMWNLVKF